MYITDVSAPAHRRTDARPAPDLTTVRDPRGPRHRRPSSWPGVTSETLGSGRRFHRLLTGTVVATAALCALLAVLFGLGGGVLTQLAMALIVNGR
jgi:hypothetical protein